MRRKKRLARSGEPPRGRHCCETTIYGGKDRKDKGKGKSEEQWLLHSLEHNKHEDNEPASLGPEWFGGKIASYAEAAGVKPAPLRPSNNPMPMSSGTLEDYYYGPLPDIKQAEFAVPEGLTGRWLVRGGQEIGA